MMTILAALITASTDGSVQIAGERLNAYQKAQNIPDDELLKLRVEIGGTEALNPIMQELKDNLRDHFQKPITKLNEDTQTMWQNTIRYAQYGFIARITMSIVVFVVGIAIVIVSGYQIIFGRLSTEELFGPSISFVSGLGTMLLIIYTGPLKEIRQSVNDLGIASAAFIAYIHRVLEISHTFSFYYLQQQITFTEMTTSSKLIEEAMSSTVNTLNPNGTKSIEEVMQEAVTNLNASIDGQ